MYKGKIFYLAFWAGAALLFPRLALGGFSVFGTPLAEFDGKEAPVHHHVSSHNPQEGKWLPGVRVDVHRARGVRCLETACVAITPQTQTQPPRDVYKKFEAAFLAGQDSNGKYDVAYTSLLGSHFDPAGAEKKEDWFIQQEVYGAHGKYLEATAGDIIIQAKAFDVQKSVFKPNPGSWLIIRPSQAHEKSCLWREIKVLPKTAAPVWVTLVGDVGKGVGDFSRLEFMNVGEAVIAYNIEAMVVFQQTPLFRSLLGHEVAALFGGGRSQYKELAYTPPSPPEEDEAIPSFRLKQQPGDALQGGTFDPAPGRLKKADLAALIASIKERGRGGNKLEGGNGGEELLERDFMGAAYSREKTLVKLKQPYTRISAARLRLFNVGFHLGGGKTLALVPVHYKGPEAYHHGTFITSLQIQAIDPALPTIIGANWDVDGPGIETLCIVNGKMVAEFDRAYVYPPLPRAPAGGADAPSTREN